MKVINSLKTEVSEFSVIMQSKLVLTLKFGATIYFLLDLSRQMLISIGMILQLKIIMSLLKILETCLIVFLNSSKTVLMVKFLLTKAISILLMQNS